MIIRNYHLAVLMTFSLWVVSCGKDDDDPENPPVLLNEEELITTVVMQFTDPSGVYPDVMATFRDIDGPGGLEPSHFDTIRLASSTLYHATIGLLNESVDPAEDLTAEVLDEAGEHIFCYTPQDADLSVVRTDSDGVFELGITSNWQTGIPGVGAVRIVLKHQPGIKDGTCEPGETDIELDFPVRVE
ncbi:MAG: type 1 periplasmic binding fold superfamily protein [Flavobacteriales bacterium]